MSESKIKKINEEVKSMRFSVNELLQMEEAFTKLNKITEPSMILKVLKTTRPFMFALKDIKRAVENVRGEAIEKMKPYSGKENDEEAQKKIKEIESEANFKLFQFQKNTLEIDFEKIKFSKIQEHVKLDVNDLIALTAVIDAES